MTSKIPPVSKVERGIAQFEERHGTPGQAGGVVARVAAGVFDAGINKPIGIGGSLLTAFGFGFAGLLVGIPGIFNRTCRDIAKGLGKVATENAHRVLVGMGKWVTTVVTDWNVGFIAKRCAPEWYKRAFLWIVAKYMQIPTLITIDPQDFWANRIVRYMRPCRMEFGKIKTNNRFSGFLYASTGSDSFMNKVRVVAGREPQFIDDDETSSVQTEDGSSESGSSSFLSPSDADPRPIGEGVSEFDADGNFQIDSSRAEDEPAYADPQAAADDGFEEVDINHTANGAALVTDHFAADDPK